MATTTYTFEELPLFTSKDGYWAGLVDGEATIDFGSDGQWKVTGVRIKVEKTSLRPYLCEPTKAIAQVIEYTLLSDPDWALSVKDEVEAELERLRNPVREPEEKVI